MGPIRAATCGALGTVAHDCILTPADVVKQRMQLGGYVGSLDCVASLWRREGPGSFYRSLPVTLAMNIPFMGMLVAANESLKIFLELGEGNLSDAPLYFFSAGVSG